MGTVVGNQKLTPCSRGNASTSHNDNPLCPTALDEVSDGRYAAVREGVWFCVIRHHAGGFLAHFEASRRFLVPRFLFTSYGCELVAVSI